MRILKYDIPTLAGSFEHIMQEGSQFLCVQSQDGEPKMWFMVDENRAGEQRRTFQTFITGQTFNLPNLYQYLGTVQLNNGAFVFHIFEILRCESAEGVR